MSIGYQLTILEPEEWKKIQREHPGVAEQDFSCFPSPADWRPAPAKFTQRACAGAGDLVYFGAKVSPNKARIPSKLLSAGGKDKTVPVMLWNGSNRIRVERFQSGSEEVIGQPIHFTFSLQFPGAQINSKFKLARKEKEAGFFTVDEKLLIQQEEWERKGPEIEFFLSADDGPYSLQLVIQKTVRKEDGEPLVFYVDRVWGLIKFALILPREEAPPIAKSK